MIFARVINKMILDSINIPVESFPEQLPIDSFG